MIENEQSVAPISIERELQLLKISNDSQRELLTLLVSYYDAVNSVISVKKKEGHNNGWSKVFHISKAIEDNYDLSVFRKNRQKNILLP